MTGAHPLVELALRIGGLSLIAVGGINALIPELHRQTVVATHWLTDASFSEAVGLSQAAPGPNMLLVPLIGWQAAGLAGAIVAYLAFLVPSAIVAIGGSRLFARYAHTEIVGAFRWALRPVTGGLMLASAVVLIGTASRTFPHGSSLTTAVLAVTSFAVCGLAMRFKFNPLVWLAIAATCGALAA